MHLLHLLEPFSDRRVDRIDRISGTDAAVAGAAACLRSQSYHTQAAIVVGPRSAEIRAHQLGIESFDTVCPIAGSRRHGVSLVNRVLNCRTAPERVVVWSSHLEEWANRLKCEIIRPWEFSFSTTSVHVKAREQNTVTRQLLRARLGIQDDTIVIGLADDPPVEADLWAFISVLAMLESGGVAVSGIAPGAAAQRGRARRFFRSLGLSQSLIITDEPIWSLSDAIDIAYVGPGMWTKAREHGESTPVSANELAWARVFAAERMLERGIPTVTSDCAAAPEALKDVLVCEGKSSAIAGKLMALADSPTLRERVSQTVREGTPSHAKWLASRVLWQVTAMPGDVEQLDLEAAVHG